jgi:hypothetical protein
MQSLKSNSSFVFQQSEESLQTEQALNGNCTDPGKMVNATQLRTEAKLSKTAQAKFYAYTKTVGALECCSCA